MSEMQGKCTFILWYKFFSVLMSESVKIKLKNEWLLTHLERSLETAHFSGVPQIA